MLGQATERGAGAAAGILPPVSARKVNRRRSGQWTAPLSDVAVDADMLAAAQETLASGWWSMGPRVSEFEEQFAAFSEARHAIAVANGNRGAPQAQVRQRWSVSRGVAEAHRCGAGRVVAEEAPGG